MMKDTTILMRLRKALCDADKGMIWECYKSKEWDNPDADIVKMIVNIDNFMKENSRLLDR